MFYKLPKPDEFGTFWIGPRTTGPAIFASKSLDDGGKIVNHGCYIVLINSTVGFIFDKEVLQRFANPDYALKALNNRLK